MYKCSCSWQHDRVEMNYFLPFPVLNDQSNSPILRWDVALHDKSILSPPNPLPFLFLNADPRCLALTSLVSGDQDSPKQQQQSHQADFLLFKPEPKVWVSGQHSCVFVRNEQISQIALWVVFSAFPFVSVACFFKDLLVLAAGMGVGLGWLVDCVETSGPPSGKWASKQWSLIRLDSPPL